MDSTINTDPTALWFHDQSLDPIPLAQLQRLARERGIEPNADTWPADGEVSFKAYWHLDLWFTNPVLPSAEPRSLLQVYLETEAGAFAGREHETLIWMKDAEFSSHFDEFDWFVPEELWPKRADQVLEERGLAAGIDFRYDVFISYRRADEAIAIDFERELTKRGLKVWRDDRLHDTAGESYQREINQALTDSAKVVTLFSRNVVDPDEGAFTSAWVESEATRAFNRKRLIPILVDPVELPAPFTVLHGIQLEKIRADFNLLLRALGASEDHGNPGTWTIGEPRVEDDKLPLTFAKQLYGRDREMAQLVDAWDDGETRVAAFDAMGGAGKTALIVHFVQQLKRGHWRGARAVFAWSFYSQGSNEDRQVGADDFFRAAFRFFGGKDYKIPDKAREKGVELAALVQKQRSLLILDGLEPLQYAAGRDGRRDTISRREEGAERAHVRRATQKLGTWECT